MTSASDGVTFDITGIGSPVQLSWTKGTALNGFLALDRNGNGRIDSGKELFGNFTEQPPSDDQNGFLALAVFDAPAKGGNGDGIIDVRDHVWENLRLWIDSNHDGTSQADELKPLAYFGLRAIALDYKESRRKDQYGNVFRYKGTVFNEEGVGSQSSRKIFDVFLLTARR